MQRICMHIKFYLAENERHIDREITDFNLHAKIC